MLPFAFVGRGKANRISQVERELKLQLKIEENPPKWTQKHYASQIKQKVALLDQVLDHPDQSKKFFECEARNFREAAEEEGSTTIYNSNPNLENLAWTALFLDTADHHYNPQMALLR